LEEETLDRTVRGTRFVRVYGPNVRHSTWCRRHRWCWRWWWWWWLWWYL